MRTILILTLIPFVLVIFLATVLLTNPETELSIGQAFLKGEAVPKNSDWGLFWIKSAADGGNPEAQAIIGRSLLVGLPKQNLPEAVKYLKMGDKNGNIECTKLLSYAYTYGQGLPQDYNLAIELSQRALKEERDGRELMGLSFFKLILPGKHRDYRGSRTYAEELKDAGYSSAWPYWCLGIIHEYGLGTAIDLPKAQKLYEQGARLGDNDSQYALARGFYEGKFVISDKKLVRSYLEAASRTQVVDAQILHALVLATTSRDKAQQENYKSLLTQLEKRGFESFSKRLRDVSSPDNVNDSRIAIKTLLDETNDVDGSKHLIAALMKRFGIGTKPNFSASIQSLDWACERYLSDATVLKGNVLTGMELGNPAYDQAFKLYKIAADKEHTYAEGQIGMLYALGLGTEHDWTKAIEYLNKAADAGDPEALYMLAGFHCDGRGVPPSRKKSIELFERAANQGHVEAMLELGIMCNSDDFPDIKQDWNKANIWFKDAAKAGLQEANYYAGSIMASRGSTDAALALFKEAAKRGHLLSEIQVGRYYMNRQKFEEARKWFNMAREQGSTTVPRELRILGLRESMLSNNPKAPLLVVAEKRIKKGTVITKDLLSTKANESEESDVQWNNDSLTNPDAAIGAVAETDISKGSSLNAADLSFTDPTKHKHE
jgi:hypothetical protein